MNKFEEAFERLKEYANADNVDDFVEIKRALIDFKDCKNELCLMCGNYKEEHNGACDGCRWK